MLPRGPGPPLNTPLLTTCFCLESHRNAFPVTPGTFSVSPEPELLPFASARETRQTPQPGSADAKGRPWLTEHPSVLLSPRPCVHSLLRHGRRSVSSTYQIS